MGAVVRTVSSLHTIPVDFSSKTCSLIEMPENSNKMVEVDTATLKMRDMNLRNMKMRHHIAGVENARHEFAAPTCKGGNCET